ncbi:hypothetical protein DQ04_11741000, partial [Trypanosoma grayi]|uniref:hypothetical protein n=1 Tax=Trypanosoma grayi TaxID=71804 RepID=UPI0004F3FFAA
MDTFQARLDALQKQSKEQITAVMAALQDACSEGTQPVRIAVAIGNRLTGSQVAASFPVICLIDAMTTKQEDAHIAAVLEEFWRIAPPLFLNYATTDEALREKVMRALKRWGGKKVFSPSISEKLLAAMSGKEVKEVTVEANEADNARRASNETKGSKIDFTRSEVSGFCSILQTCMKMIQQLPPHRASMYLEVARKEKLLQTPSRSALLFFKGLHAELTRESALYNSNVVKSEHQAFPALSSGTETKAALGNLLDRLAKELASPAAPASSNTDHSFHVVRYVSPLQSDICQRLS